MPHRGRKKARSDDDGEVSVRIPRSSVPAKSRKRVAMATRSLSENDVSVRDNSPEYQPVLSPLEQSFVDHTRSSSPVVETRKARSNTLRLGNFSGVGCSLSSHLAKWRNCAAYYQWDEVERVCHLKHSLVDSAESLLWQIPADISEADLLKLLELRFGDASQVELHRAMLKNRKRRRGETLQSLHNDLCRLLNLAFPGETSSLLRIVGRDSFLESLCDPELRLKILESGATCLDDAYAIAVRLESFKASGAALEVEDGARSKVRSTQVPGEGNLLARLGNVEAAIARFTDVVQNLSLPARSAQRVPARELPSAAGQSKPADVAAAAAAEVSLAQQRAEPSLRRAGMNRRACYVCGEFDHLMRDCPKRSVRQPHHGSDATGNRDGRGNVRVVQRPMEMTEHGKTSTSEVYVAISWNKGKKNFSVDAIIDSGSAMNLLPRRLYDGRLKPCSTQLAAVNGSKIHIDGEIWLTFTIGLMRFKERFIVTSYVDEVILGMPWLLNSECSLNCAKAEAVIRGCVTKLKCKAASLLSRRVLLSETVCLQPRECAAVPVIVARTSLKGGDTNFVLEPKLVNAQAITPRALLSSAQNAVIRVLNPSDEEVILKRYHCIGIADCVDLSCKRCGKVCLCSGKTASDNDAKNSTAQQHRNFSVRAVGNLCASDTVSDGQPECDIDDELSEDDNSNASDESLTDDASEVIEPILNTLPHEITADDRASIRALLMRYNGIFARHEFDIGRAKCTPKKLVLKDPSLPPVCQPLRSHPYACLKKIDDHVNKLIQADVVTPCTSAWQSNLLLIPKHNQPGRYRIALDMRAVNERLVRDVYPIPSMGTILDSLRGKVWFHSLDISQAFLSLPIDETTSDPVTFVTRQGQFRYKRLSPGLSVGPAWWNQFCTQRLFKNLQWSHLCCFFDDVIMGSHDINSGLELLEQVFQRVQQYDVRLKVEKCRLFQRQIAVLGVVVSQNEIRPDPKRAEVVRKLQFPRSERELKSFLSFCSFSRNFYPNFAGIAYPLTACLRKSARLVRTAETLQCFEDLKRLMCSEPVLQMYNPDCKQLVIECDSTQKTNCAAALFQEDELGNRGIVAYYSKTLSDQEKRYCVSRLEILGAIKALLAWKKYLIGKPVVIKTDHSCLQYVLKGKTLSPQFCRYFDFLSQFDVRFEYQPGKKQLISDYLSRYANRPCEIQSGLLCKQCRSPEERRELEFAMRRQARGNCEVQQKTQRETMRMRNYMQLASLSQSSGHAESASAGGNETGNWGYERRSKGVSEFLPVTVRARDSEVAGSQPAVAVSSGEVEKLGSGTVAGQQAVDAVAHAGSISRQQTCAADEDDRVDEASEGRPVDMETELLNYACRVTTRGDAARQQQASGDEDAAQLSGTNSGECVAFGAPTSEQRAPLDLTELWSSASIAESQRADTAITAIMKVIETDQISDDIFNSHDREIQCYLGQRQSLIIRQGILYREFVDVKGRLKHYQLILPKSLRESFMKHVHEVTLCHLKSVMKVEAEVSRLAYWPLWKTDVKLFLSKCRVCCSYHTGKLPKNAYLRDNDGSLSRPGIRASLDLVGPFPESQQYRYALTLCDMFSRYMFVYPLKSKCAVGVARGILKFSLVHGWYAIYKHDFGGEFVNEVMDQLFKLTGIRRHTSFSYLPRENLIERGYRTLNSMLGKVLDSHKDWVNYLDAVASAYNASVHKATSFSPNFLHFGREISTSLDVLMANPQVEGYQNFGDFAEETRQRMQLAFSVAREVGLKLAGASKKYYDARVRPKTLNLGDVVLAYCPNRKRNTFTKWSRPFSKTGRVIRKVNDSVYVVKMDQDGRERIFHIDKLRLVERAELAVSEPPPVNAD